ncbi:MAG: response regulator [Promethearchaeota archaeon]
MKIRKIMIVEDDLSLQELYSIILKSKGYKIYAIASNGQEAVEIFKRSKAKPDIIIMDYRMPIKNGIEATKEIRALDSNIKIIFASADASIKDQVLSLGVAAFHQKPFTMNELIRSIEENDKF